MFHRNFRAWPRKIRWNLDEASMTAFAMLRVNVPLVSFGLCDNTHIALDPISKLSRAMEKSWAHDRNERNR